MIYEKHWITQKIHQGGKMTKVLVNDLSDNYFYFCLIMFCNSWTLTLIEKLWLGISLNF